jgi:CubicO group peptidase (beta-lactamase class C family)
MSALHPSTLLRGGRLALAIGFVLSSIAAATADDRFEPVRQRIAKALVDHNIPSIAVAVAHEGEIVWEQAFGWADRENRSAANEHTLYSLASISKPITATGLMVLVEQKKLDLDKPANDYLGVAKLRAHRGDAADASLRRIANHTSGLPLHYQFFYADEDYRPPTRDETIRRFGNLMTEPGEHYQYSNLGYGVLDYVIQRASGNSFAGYMREEVFLPLGLTHTSVGVGGALEPHQAIRYTPDGRRIPSYEFDHDGASAVYASAHDLARFAMFHLKEHLPDQRAILSDASIDEMQQSTTPSDSGSSYGIGWGTGVHRHGYRFVQHTGGMPGVSTICTLYPTERLAIVVLANSRNPVGGYLSEMILKTMLPETGPESLENMKPQDDAGGGAMLSSELSGAWRGKLVTHQGEIPLVLEVKDDSDVHVRLGNQLETLLSGARFHDGWLRGRFAGDVGTDDNRGRDYTLHLEAKLRDDTLSGPITAITLPDAWGSSAVSYWVELKHEPETTKTTANTRSSFKTAGDCPNFAQSAEQNGTVPLPPRY